jgi:LacI family transcriptional regulator
MGIKDVARLAGVSPTTVSRVLNNSAKVHPDTREAVLRAIKESGYRPNQIARSLRLRRFRSIGLIVPDISNEFFATIAQAIEDELQKEGYNLFLCNTGEDRQRERKYIKALLDKFVDGIIFVSAGFDESLDLFQDEIPVVAVDRKPNMEGVSFIDSANYEGGYLATKHLISNGCRRILMIRDEREVRPMKARFEGYKQCLKDYNIEYDEELVAWVPVDRTAVREYLLKVNGLLEFDGIFAGNDVMAISAAHTLLKLGSQVPEQIQIVGFDNITEGAYFVPGITTIAQQTEALGRRSAQVLLELIKDPKRGPIIEELPVALIKRGSTR